MRKREIFHFKRWKTTLMCVNTYFMECPIKNIYPNVCTLHRELASERERVNPHDNGNDGEEERKRDPN